MVRRGTGLHADDARRQSFEERHNLAAAKLLSDDDLLGPVNAVNLEHVLGDIQTDRGNLHVDGSPHVIRLDETPYGTTMPGAGALHHIKSRKVAQVPKMPRGQNEPAHEAPSQFHHDSSAVTRSGAPFGAVMYSAFERGRLTAGPDVIR